MYSIFEPQIMDAACFGVPQHRERVIVVGNRISKDFVYPSPKKAKGSFTTVWDAIGKLPQPEMPSEAVLRVAASIKGRRERHGY